MEDPGRKSAKSRRETSVQGTNDSSVVSKCSTSTCGYFNDQFLQHFVAKQNRRAPLIHRGYYIRAVAFDRVFRKFLMDNAGTKSQIISLGCGFDSTYFRLKDAGLLQDTTFYEVDFPDLVRRKHRLIECKETLMKFLEKKEITAMSPHIEFSCQDYHLLGVDLTMINTLEAALKMCGMDFELPTLLFSECVMTYMTRRCSTDVVKWAAETFERATFAMYEQMNPDDSFGLFMQHHFHSIGSPLKCINAFPTLNAQKERFLKNGWTSCEAVDMNHFYYQCLSPTERSRVENLEAFDEYEELNLKYSHYFIMVASTECPPLQYLMTEPQSQDHSVRNLISDVITIDRVQTNHFLHRFGHASNLMPGDYILTTGGFGEVDGRHQRLTDITVTDINSLESYHISCVSPDIQYSRMHHTALTLSNGSTYLIAGRQSPYFMCSQMLKVNLTFNAKSNISNPSKVSTSSDETNGDLKSEKMCNPQDCDSLCVRNTTRGNGCGAAGDNLTTEISKCGDHVNISSGPHIWECPFGMLHVEIVQQSGEVPLDRWRHAATVVCVDGAEKIFLHGGKTKSGDILDDAYLFDPKTQEWRRMSCSGDVPGPRHSHNALVWKQFVVLSGGLDKMLVPLNDVHLLDLTTGVWEKLDISSDLSRRYSHTSQIIGDKLVLIGGVHLCHPPPGVGVVNLASRTSVEFSLPCENKSNLLMLHRITSVKLNSEKILVLGGGGNCFSFGTHLNHTPVILNVTKALDAVP